MDKSVRNNNCASIFLIIVFILFSIILETLLCVIMINDSHAMSIISCLSLAFIFIPIISLTLTIMVYFVKKGFSSCLNILKNNASIELQETQTNVV
jgi:hypothetical protein